MTDGPTTPYRTPDAPPKARLPLLADKTVRTPCKVSWESMVGDERVRFCCRCSKNVYDLSAMTEDEAESFLAVHLDDEDACVRLYRRSDGRLLTTDCPVGAKKRHQTKVVLAVAAGAVTITAAAAVAADMNVPRAHSPLHSVHTRFEPPRAFAPAPYRGTFLPASPPRAPYYFDPPWGRAEEPLAIQAGRPPGSSATLRQGAMQVAGALPPEVVARIVRQNFGRFRLCYENGLRHDPTLRGRIVTSFVIESDGSVSRIADAGSDLPDDGVLACVLRANGNMSFPQPEQGVVKVKYPIIFNPGD